MLAKSLAPNNQSILDSLKEAKDSLNFKIAQDAALNAKKIKELNQNQEQSKKSSTETCIIH